MGASTASTMAEATSTRGCSGEGQGVNFLSTPPAHAPPEQSMRTPLRFDDRPRMKIHGEYETACSCCFCMCSLPPPSPLTAPLSLPNLRTVPWIARVPGCEGGGEIASCAGELLLPH